MSSRPTPAIFEPAEEIPLVTHDDFSLDNDLNWAIFAEFVSSSAAPVAHMLSGLNRRLAVRDYDITEGDVTQNRRITTFCNDATSRLRETRSFGMRKTFHKTDGQRWDSIRFFADLRGAGGFLLLFMRINRTGRLLSGGIASSVNGTPITGFFERDLDRIADNELTVEIYTVDNFVRANNAVSLCIGDITVTRTEIPTTPLTDTINMDRGILARLADSAAYSRQIFQSVQDRIFFGRFVGAFLTDTIQSSRSIIGAVTDTVVASRQILEYLTDTASARRSILVYLADTQTYSRAVTAAVSTTINLSRSISAMVILLADNIVMSRSITAALTDTVTLQRGILRGLATDAMVMTRQTFQPLQDTAAIKRGILGTLTSAARFSRQIIGRAFVQGFRSKAMSSTGYGSKSQSTQGFTSKIQKNQEFETKNPI